MTTKPVLKELEKKIRDLKKEIAGLKISEATYKTIFKHSPLAILSVDMNGKILESNERLLDWLGYRSEELVGKNFTELEFMFDESKAKVMEKFKLRMKGEKVLPYSVDVITKSGEKRIGQIAAKTIKNRDGNVIKDLVMILDITEKQKKQEEFYESLKQSNAFFQAIPDMVFVVTKDGTFIDFKSDIDTELAIPREEIIGKNISDTGFSEKNYKLVMNSIRKTINSGNVQTFEYDLITPEGVGFFECRMARLNKKEVLAIIRNITKHKKSEEDLRNSEKRYRALFEDNNDAVFIFNLEGIHMEANIKAAEMLGCSVKDLIGRPATHFIAKREKENSSVKMESLLKGEKLPVYERVFRRLDGTEFPGEINVSLVYDNDGKPIHFQSIVRDITKRKQAVLDIEKRQKFLESFLNNIPEAIVLLDSSHHIVEWNPGAEKMFGYLHKEVVGKNIDDLITGKEYLKEAKKLTKKVLAGEAIYSFESVRYRKDGTPVNVIVSGSPVKIRGELQGIVAIYIDISMRKMMEEELKRADKLESLAILAGGIAHDFNNILASILVNIGLFELYKDNDVKRNYKLKEIEVAILRAKDLTQQLLTFSKGNAPIKTPASIKELLEETVNFSLSGSNVKCKFLIPENLWTVEIDEGQISQVIQNIIINGIQAMPKGGTINVRVQNVAKEDMKNLPLKKSNYIRLEVEDQGIGISKSHLKNIFDPFFTTKQKGGGLGLATAFSIVKNHDGLITVESELGKKTIFCIYLPAMKMKVKKKGKDKDTIISGSGKILLMDDDEMILMATGELLRRIGYSVITAKDGSEAIELYKNHKESKDVFDCVILDLTVPNGLGGKETIKKLREIDPDVKALASSGYSIDPILSDCEKFGFSGAIPKPYVITELSMLIHKVLKK